LLTDGTSAVTDRYSYDAYGMMLGGEPGVTDQAATSMLYSGEQFDSELGWNYQRARYYDMGVGRWNRVDPFEGQRLKPMSFHRYLFCQADPVNTTDLSGMQGTSVAEMQTTMSLATAEFAYVPSEKHRQFTEKYRKKWEEWPIWQPVGDLVLISDRESRRQKFLERARTAYTYRGWTDYWSVGNVADAVTAITNHKAKNPGKAFWVVLIGHGRAGGIRLGTELLAHGGGSSTSFQNFVAACKPSSPGGARVAHVYLFGCRVSSGTAGRETASALASQADVDVRAWTKKVYAYRYDSPWQNITPFAVKDQGKLEFWDAGTPYDPFSPGTDVSFQEIVWLSAMPAWMKK